MNLRFDYSNSGISALEVDGMKALVEAAHNTLHNKTGLGNDYLGWVDLPVDYDKDEFAKVKAAAKSIQEKADVLVVIGIGGSYLGAKSAIEALTNSFYNLQDQADRKGPQVIFAGHTISGPYLAPSCKLSDGTDGSPTLMA